MSSFTGTCPQCGKRCEIENRRYPDDLIQSFVLCRPCELDWRLDDLPHGDGTWKTSEFETQKIPKSKRTIAVISGIAIALAMFALLGVSGYFMDAPVVFAIMVPVWAFILTGLIFSRWTLYGPEL